MTAHSMTLSLVLVTLLFGSAFFSGAETALFGLTQRDRAALMRHGGVGVRATFALLARPRTLLITILLGNMSVNVTYFVVSSVLLLKSETTLERAIWSVTPLLVIILFGEVLPKLTAAGGRVWWCRVFAPPLLAVHRAIGPIRTPLEALVVVPLARLFSPRPAPPMTTDELRELLTVSERSGVIAPDEAGLLDAVGELGELRVRDIMVPRVEMAWLPASATRDDALAMLEQTPIRIIPVCERSLDDGVTGVVSVKRLLRAPESATVGSLAIKPLFVPVTATVDALLNILRAKRRRIAIAVDEYGGVVGEVSIAGVIDRLAVSLEQARAGERHDAPEADVEAVGPGVWRAPGRLPIHAWREVFGSAGTPHASTLGGLVVAALGRFPEAGEKVTIGPVTITVESVDAGAVKSALVSLAGDANDREGGSR
jgi:putative hemolysin